MTTMTQTADVKAQNLNNALTAEWRSRPDDERFLTLDDLHAATLARANRCAVLNTNTKRIKPIAMPLQPEQADPEMGADVEVVDRHFGMVFETEAGFVDATHWSFGQLAKVVKTPADYLRRVDTRLAAKLIDYGFGYLAPKEDYQLFTEQVEGRGQLQRMRGFNGTGFGRIYDHEAVDMVRQVADPDVWKPPVHNYSGQEGSKKATTLYGSDRDVSIFLVDDQHPVEITVAGRTEVLRRGFCVRNSEVGLTKFKVFLFFYRYTCQNRLLWAPSHLQEIGITHTSGAPERFRREAAPMLERFATADVTEVKTRIERAMKLEVGRDRETITEWLGKQGFTKGEAGDAFDRAKEEEGRTPTTIWDLVQGGTALARGITHTDARIEREEKWSRLLDKAA